MSALLDYFRAAGGKMFRTAYDGVLGQLLIAAGQPEAARQRLDTALALAQDTGMCFHDAELLRLRAQTHDEPAARQAEINAALELVRRQGATLFELRLRSTISDSAVRRPPPPSPTPQTASLPTTRGRN